ncbi:MAG: caspase family protein [Bacteroidia bacterium]|nr:caspase family protein [Bacteroidia bacterium]
MKRRALLFGNSNGLPGVKLDIEHFLKFLMSEQGGCWTEFEIIVEMNPTRTSLLALILAIKAQKPDFTFVVFSGHGGYSKGTVLEINKNEEVINESELRWIAPRQISIFDCCRNVSTVTLMDSKALFRSQYLNEARNNILRQAYESRIMQAIEQQVSLYACSVGESSYDTNEGGIYSNCFLSSVTPLGYDRFKLVGVAQEEAKPKTTKKALEVYSKIQTPDQSISKCLSSEQLIISINPTVVTI